MRQPSRERRAVIEDVPAPPNGRAQVGGVRLSGGHARIICADVGRKSTESATLQSYALGLSLSETELLLEGVDLLPELEDLDLLRSRGSVRNTLRSSSDLLMQTQISGDFFSPPSGSCTATLPRRPPSWRRRGCRSARASAAAQRRRVRSAAHAAGHGRRDTTPARPARCPPPQCSLLNRLTALLGSNGCVARYRRHRRK